MKVKFENVVDGINRYIDKEIYINLNSMQEFVARLFVGRINQNAETIKISLMNNGFARTLNLIDSDGMVDVDQLLHDIRKEIERQGSIQFEIPMIGKLTFKAEDVDILYNKIVER